MNDPAQLLSIFLGGTLGRSGRKRASRAATFLGGRKGFLTASTLITAAGVAWGLYDSMRGGASAAPGGASAPWSQPPLSPSSGGVPPLPVAPPAPASNASVPVPADVLRIVRLAVSAARADGLLSPQERELILRRAGEAGLLATVEQEIAQPQPLADIVRGVTDPTAKRDLYTLAFSIVRADESVSGGERIYLAQLAHQLGLDQAAVADIETRTAQAIDSQA